MITGCRFYLDFNTFTFLLLTFDNCIVSTGFLPEATRVAFPGESHLRQSRATHPTVHAGYFSASMIHRTLTWTTGSLTCAQMLMRAIAHGGVRTHVRESALKVDSGRKIPCRTGESNLRQRRDGPMLYKWATFQHFHPYWLLAIVSNYIRRFTRSNFVSCASFNTAPALEM